MGIILVIGLSILYIILSKKNKCNNNCYICNGCEVEK